MKLVERFLKDSAKLGYALTGSVFKVDYNGRTYTVGFWLRPVDWNNKKQAYRLPGRIGKAKHENFDEAVKAAIKIALKDERYELSKQK